MLGGLGMHECLLVIERRLTAAHQIVARNAGKGGALQFDVLL